MVQQLLHNSFLHFTCCSFEESVLQAEVKGPKNSPQPVQTSLETLLLWFTSSLPSLAGVRMSEGSFWGETLHSFSGTDGASVFMCFTNVNFQSLLRLEVRITMITLETWFVGVKLFRNFYSVLFCLFIFILPSLFSPELTWRLLFLLPGALIQILVVEIEDTLSQ